MAEIDVHTSDVNASQQPCEKVESAQVRKGTILVITIVIASFALLALFANIQRFRRHKIETVVVTPADSITPQPR
jgi:hypothetical protein